MRKTWRCPKCEACYDGDGPVVCKDDHMLMQIWNITDDSKIQPPRITLGEVEWPAWQWLQDRSEDECVLCNRPLNELDPQEFVALVYKAEYSFPIAAACGDCAVEVTV